jgi:hypothetical protein
LELILPLENASEQRIHAAKARSQAIDASAVSIDHGCFALNS